MLFQVAMVIDDFLLNFTYYHVLQISENGLAMLFQAAMIVDDFLLSFTYYHVLQISENGF